jgi:ABC-type dipeptide/oligopeptide/nickel transport system permease subunit
MVTRDPDSIGALPGSGREWLDRLGSALTGIKGFARRKPLGMAGAVVLVAMVFVAIFAPLLAPRDPYDTDAVNSRYLPPGRTMLLGGDIVGRDAMSRLIYGTRISLTVGLTSVFIGLAIGSLAGTSSAYFGGKFDLAMQRIIDGLMAFPALILALAVMAVLGSSINNVIAALVVVFVPGITRIIRSQVLSIKEMDYVLAARAVGAGPWRIIFRHIFPNIFATLLVLATITLGWAIVVEASLSFLGVGVPPDIPSWGSMLSGAAQTYIRTAPWLIIGPGVAIALAVFSVNLFGDALRDVLDPRLRVTGGT